MPDLPLLQQAHRAAYVSQSLPSPALLEAAPAPSSMRPYLLPTRVFASVGVTPELGSLARLRNPGKCSSIRPRSMGSNSFSADVEENPSCQISQAAHTYRDLVKPPAPAACGARREASAALQLIT
jgi:hypothetical protein